jgi:hypothetical protein
MNINEQLANKRILLLSVQTFNYETVIANKLRNFGAIVDYYDERPVNSLFAKGIIRLKRTLYQKRIDNYYYKILNDLKGTKYDFLFVIRGEVVPEFFLEAFKIHNPKCYLLFYTWDSFTNHTHPIKILKYFDKCFTFDSNDAKKYNLNLRPLFFMEEYDKINDYKTALYKYDLLFIGTAHSDRYLISRKVMEWCTSQHLKTFEYYFIHSKLVYYYKRLFDPTFQYIDYKKLSFKSLKVEEIVSLYKDSVAILDVNHPGQNGLTMRTFEALGAGKKIITTNSEIKKYPFYNKNNVFIINRDNPSLSKSFFATPFVALDSELRNSMSIGGWIIELFDKETNRSWTKPFK